MKTKSKKTKEINKWMQEAKRLPVKISQEFNNDLNDIYYFGMETFGIKQAEIYESEVWNRFKSNLIPLLQEHDYYHQKLHFNTLKNKAIRLFL